MSCYTNSTGWASSWRARKQDTDAFNTSKSSGALSVIGAITATYWRIYIATSRRPGADYTDVETR